MAAGTYELVNGICALIAALLIWYITHSFLGWLVLFIPGSVLVLLGIWKNLNDKTP
jgi:hypothetical protein